MANKHIIISIFDRLLSILSALATILLAGMLVLVCVSIFMRYVFREPIAWSIEIVEYGLLWVGFLAAAGMLREEGHVKMDLFLASLTTKNRARLSTGTSLLGAILCLVLTKFTFEKTWMLFQDGDVVISMLGPPKFIIAMVIPASLFLLAIQFIRDTCGNFKQWRELN